MTDAGYSDTMDPNDKSVSGDIMNLTGRLFLTVFGSGLAVLSFTAAAHHSSSEYDENQVVEVQGEVVDVFWRNPHVMIKVATEENGQEAVWELEGSSVSSLRRRGLSSDVLSVGDHVRVAGFPSTRQPGHMSLNHLLLPTGEEVVIRYASGPRWTDRAAFASGERVFDPAKVAAARKEAHGFFRVWTWGREEPGWWFFSDAQRFPLTETALAGLQSYNEVEDNPVRKCIAPGMPATMGNPYPLTFVQVDQNTIQIREEEFDRVRTIHLNADRAADVEPSPLGYSVGRWENENTLVIKTNKINAPYFNRVGVRQSEAVEVDERFVLSEDGSRLDYDLMITDPATLTEPWAWHAHWNWVPGEEVGTYQCTVPD